MRSPLRKGSYVWLITNDMDTNVANSSCTYDRIVITESALSEYGNSAGVYRFDQVSGLTAEETKDVSDHYPVWAEFSANDLDDDTSAKSGGGCFVISSQPE